METVETLVPVAALAEELHGLEIVYVQPDGGWDAAVEPGEVYRWGERTNAMWEEDDVRSRMGLVLIGAAVVGDYNMSSTYTRANFEALPADFPDTFLQMGLSEYDGMQLALPLGAMIPESLAVILRQLEDYPVYDEDVVARVEMEIQDQDWDTATKYDLLHEVAQYFNLTPGLPFTWSAVELTWEEMDQWATFAAALHFTESYPVFETSTSCYYPDMDVIAADVAVRIMSAHNRLLLDSFA